MSKKDTVILFKGIPYKDDPHRAKSRVPLVPLSLLSLAGPLKNAGYTVKIIDQQDLTHQTFESLKSLWPRVVCVGVSALTGNEIAEAITFAKFVKDSFPHIPIIWGGWHVSIFPEKSLESSYADIIVKGVGQKTFLELVGCIAEHRDFENISHLYYKRGNTITKTNDRDSFAFDEHLLPAFDMVDLEYYRKHSLFLRYRPVINDVEITGHLYYVSSFGCPNECAYCCSSTVFGKKLYRYNIEEVVTQIRWLVEEKKFNFISFMDANFFIDKERVKQLCKLILDSRLNFFWDAQICVSDIIRYEENGLWDLLKESGCYQVNIGAESGSQEILDYIAKNIKVDDILESARIITRHGIKAAYNFLFGLPAVERKRHIYESFELAKGLKKINQEFSLPVSFYVPFPGTRMYRDALKRGLRAPDALEAWGQFDPNYDFASIDYPWKSIRQERLIYNVITFYTPLALPGNMYRGTLRLIKDKMKSSRVRLFIKIGHYLARFRLQYSFYHFPFEIMIFKIYRFVKKSPGYLPGGKCEE